MSDVLERPKARTSAKPAQRAKEAEHSGRTRDVNIRARERDIGLIDYAARELGTSRSNFMMETAVRAAEEVLLDKRLFTLDRQTFDRFMERLDAPAKVNPKLRTLLRSAAPWDK